ncbi:MAG: LamG domain-containing protein [Polyangiales bacterium]
MVAGCAGSAGPVGPSFEVSFDPATPRSARDQTVRVEVYLVDSCTNVTLGTRPVPALGTADVLRGDGGGAFGIAFDDGDYGLYGLAQDAECAVVAAGCAPVAITGAQETLTVTLGAFRGEGCPVDEYCSLETGDCLDGTGGTGGTGGSGGEGGRVDTGLILFYAFDEGSGSTVTDQSDVLPKHDLTIANPRNVAWSTDHLSINTATALSSTGAATKVVARAQASGELTVEAWITPADATQGGPARIISMSTDPWVRNFMLGQESSTYAARFRADGEQDWDNGSPTIFTATGTASVALTHVVHTHSASGAEVLYVNGVENETFTRMGGLSQWDATYPIIVANEGTNDRAWLGELHLIAVYDRALDAAEVEQNFTAGP